MTTVDWHPDNKILVAGSTDYKVRVFSGFISDMEDAPGTSPWGQSKSLGTLLAEFPNTPSGGIVVVQKATTARNLISSLRYFYIQVAGYIQ